MNKIKINVDFKIDNKYIGNLDNDIYIYLIYIIIIKDTN